MSRLGITSDLWTHEVTSRAYITVTAHYINSDWKLCAVVLATREMENSKTAVNIRGTLWHAMHCNVILYNICFEFVIANMFSS